MVPLYVVLTHLDPTEYVVLTRLGAFPRNVLLYDILELCDVL